MSEFVLDGPALEPGAGADRPDHTITTPCFLVDLGDVRARLAAFEEHLPGVGVHYAMKANPEPEIVGVLARSRAGFEAASIYEIDQLAGRGVDPATVVFGSAVKSVDHIAAAHACGVRTFAADSAAELTKIAAGAPGGSVYIRVAVDDRGSAFEFREKFAAQGSDAADLVRFARARGLDPAGLSFHVGSQAARPDVWADAIRSLAPIYHQLAGDGAGLRSLNIGGGFPCQYRGASAPSLDQIGTAIVDARRHLPDGVGLVAEPGRYLVASAAQLVTTVIGRAERGATSWLFLNAGCNNGLFEAVAYQGRTPYPIMRVDPPASPARCRFSLAGPTGDSADVIARDIDLPADTGLGDRIAFRNAGAYTMSASAPSRGPQRPRVHYR